jgi:polysaccharide deacetylase family protein (PEP-CTERM system associated)
MSSSTAINTDPAPGISFTLDLEDGRETGAKADRLEGVTRRLLAFLAEREVRGTVFVVGELAEGHPALVRDVADQGHEIALHAYRHVPLTKLDEAAFRSDTIRGKLFLEDLTGREVVGYRAPIFSLVRSTAWAADILGELGFTYSSSVLPAKSPLFGFPGCPSTPFTWPSGLVELPVPVAAFGSTGIPFLGGVYLRVLPWPFVKLGLITCGRGQSLWTYCHAHDFDADEPFRLIDDLGWAGSRLFFANRGRMFDRIDRLIREGLGPALADRVAAGLHAPRIPANLFS